MGDVLGVTPAENTHSHSNDEATKMLAVVADIFVASTRSQQLMLMLVKEQPQLSLPTGIKARVKEQPQLLLLTRIKAQPQLNL